MSGMTGAFIKYLEFFVWCSHKLALYLKHFAFVCFASFSKLMQIGLNVSQYSMYSFELVWDLFVVVAPCELEERGRNLTIDNRVSFFSHLFLFYKIGYINGINNFICVFFAHWTASTEYTPKFSFFRFQLKVHFGWKTIESFSLAQWVKNVTVNYEYEFDWAWIIFCLCGVENLFH